MPTIHPDRAPPEPRSSGIPNTIAIPVRILFVAVVVVVGIIFASLLAK